MSIQRFSAFDQYENFKESTEMSNSFIVDIDNLSTSAPNGSPSTDSRISVKLQQNLSKKGSQREDRNKIVLSASIENTFRSSSTGTTLMAGDCYPNKCTSSPMASLGEKSVNKQRPMITISAEKGFNIRKSIKHQNSFVDPRQVLFFFATLSSMGTIVLIYLTLSISRVGGSINS